MRRIGTKHARLGMILGRPVYDNRGYLLLDTGTEMNRESLTILVDRAVPEIIVQDPRTSDIIVKPIIAPELESATAVALKKVIAELKKTGELDEGLMQKLQQSLNSMVREMFPVAMGEANVAGCFSLEDYDVVQPTRAACLAMLVSRRLDSGIVDTANLGMAGLLMNLGNILEGGESEVQEGAPGQLWSDTSGENHNHPKVGSRFLSKAKRFDPEIVEGILHHHERWDGSGFPSGLVREQISPFARILAIADTFYELLSVRPDRKGYMPHEAVEYILAYSGELFDPTLVQLFTALVPLYPTGSTVKLSTGEIGVVASANEGIIGRPTVRICSLGGTNVVQRPYDINLTGVKHQSKLVTEVDPYLEAA